MTAATLAAAANAPAQSSEEAHFRAIADALGRALQPGERYTANYAGERTDFVRFNRAKVRQPGSVAQAYLAVRLVNGARHAEHTLSLTGNPADDARAACDAMAGLRVALDTLVDDPHLLLPDTVTDTHEETGGPLPPSADVIDRVLDAARGLDLVGLYAAGPVTRGFANSDGQRNWHAVTTFNLQWSLYHRADKAVKSSYAGLQWDAAAFEQRMHLAREQLAFVARPPRTLAPGRYRAYIAPAAVDEIASLLRYAAFSGRAIATQQSPLMRMKEGQCLDARVTIAEDFATGVAPAFQADGFVRPARVPLIERGKLAGALVNPRTAREFALEANGANGGEMPEALAMDGGALRESDALAVLGTGLAIGNLWYTNFSDRPAARITGMTRFATFWVEDGRIVAPVDVLRFDDTLFRLLGSELEALTAQPELMLSPDTYRARQLASSRLPGLLVGAMTFTL